MVSSEHFLFSLKISCVKFASKGDFDSIEIRKSLVLQDFSGFCNYSHSAAEICIQLYPLLFRATYCTYFTQFSTFFLAGNGYCHHISITLSRPAFWQAFHLTFENHIIMIAQAILVGVEPFGECDTFSLKTDKPSMCELIALRLDLRGASNRIIGQDCNQALIESLVIKRIKQESILWVRPFRGRPAAPEGFNMAGDKHSRNRHSRDAAGVFIRREDGCPEKVTLSADPVFVRQRGERLCAIERIRVKESKTGQVLCLDTERAPIMLELIEDGAVELRNVRCSFDFGVGVDGGEVLHTHDERTRRVGELFCNLLNELVRGANLIQGRDAVERIRYDDVLPTPCNSFAHIRTSILPPILPETSAIVKCNLLCKISV